MAVQVLDYQGLPSMQRISNDGCEVMSASLQGMQHLMNLLSQKQMRQAQDAYLHIPDAPTSDFKKATTLIGGVGHARFRRAPGGSPSTSSPTALFRLLQSGDSPAAPPSPPLFQTPSNFSSSDVDHFQVRSSPCLDATQPTCIPDTPVPEAHSMHPDFTCRPCNIEGAADGDAHVANDHMDSPIVCEKIQTMHVPHLCNSGEKEQNADGSVYDASTRHHLRVHGHARCREVMKNKVDHQASATKPFSERACREPEQAAFGACRTNSSFVSSLSLEERGGTVSSGKPLFSSARPPLPPKKRKASEKVEETDRKCHKSGQCHCAHKRRKLHSRTVIRVPVAIDVTSSDVPAPDDGHFWCSYGQKFVEGSLYPRVYFRCSSVRGCPARKHVQRASEDSNILIVTYGRKHMHPQIQKVPVPSG